MVGERLSDYDSTNAGAAYVIFLTVEGEVKSYNRLIDSGIATSTTDSDYLGSSVTNIGDLNGDGVQDIAIGAYGDDNGATDAGSIHIVFLNRDGTSTGAVEINDTNTFDGVLTTSDSLGYHGLAVIGDIDGDGVTDLAVGARGDDAGATDAGAVYIILMNTDGSTK